MGCKSIACGFKAYRYMGCKYMVCGYVNCRFVGPVGVPLNNRVIVWTLNGCCGWNEVV